MYSACPRWAWLVGAMQAQAVQDTKQALRVRLVRCFWANQAHGVQTSVVWLTALPLEPCSSDAFSPLLPASPETSETIVSAEPGSAHAAVSLLMMY
jgi:hypothetical protein